MPTIHKLALSVMLLLPVLAHAQEQTPVPIIEAPPAAAAVSPATEAAPCCGVITPEGERLIEAIDGLDVEHHWLAGEHVYWMTGERDRPGGAHETHCSSFAAAVGYHLNVYLLRPPQHGIEELQGAQARWLISRKAREAGWFPVSTMAEAQGRANRGEFVVVFYINPDPHRAGHIAVVRPSEKTMSQLQQEGPQTTQAGETNRKESFVARGFSRHPGAFPNNVHYYAHTIEWNEVHTEPMQ